MSRASSTRLVVAPWRELISGLAAELIPRIDPLGRFQEPVETPVVIVPGGGVARGLQQAIADRLGRPFVSPRFLTIERLAESVLSSREGWVPAANAGIRATVMEAAARSAAASRFGDPARLAAIATRSWRDAVDSGTDPWRIRARARIGAADPLADVERVWRRYNEILTKARLRDPADLLAEAAEVLRTGASCPSVAAVFGFYDATGMQTRLLRALVEHIGVPAVWVPAVMQGEGLADEYAFAERLIHDLGLELASADSGSALPSRRVTFDPAATASLQRKRVCDRIAAELSSGTALERIGVVARTLPAAEIEMWNLAAAKRGFTFASREIRPLTGHRVGRAIRILLHLDERSYQRSDVMELIDAGLRPLRDARRQSGLIESHTRAARIASGGSGVLGERHGSDAPEAIALYVRAVADLERLVQPLRQTATGREWAALISDWLRALQVSTEEDIACITRAQEWADELGFLAGLEISREEISRSLGRVEVDFGRSRGAFIGDVMGARGNTFDLLFLIDARDGVLPQGRVQDPLLRDDVRERLGMRAIGTGEAEERMLFRGLLDSSLRTTIVWTESDDRGRPTRPSSLVSALAIELHPRDTAEILGDISAWARRRDTKVAADAGRDALLVRRILRRESGSVPAATFASLNAFESIGSRGRWDGYLQPSEDLRERLVERLGAISPTALEHYGSCPQKFLIRGVLRIDEIDEPEDLLELEARDKGTALHGALERFYRALPGTTLTEWNPSNRRLPHHLAILLDESISAEFEQMDSSVPPRFPRMRELERREARRALERFLIEDLSELAATGFIPTHFEFRFGEIRGEAGNAPALELDIGGVRLQVRGSIDRVDVHPDGRVRIVDYKRSGNAHRNFAAKVASGRSLQLAMYCRAWSVVMETPPDRISAQILPIRVTGGTPAREDLAFEYAAVAPRLERTLTLFAAGILDGWFPALPGEHCEYCPVGSTCRVRNDPEAVVELEGIDGAGAWLWPGEVWD